LINAYEKTFYRGKLKNTYQLTEAVEMIYY